MPEPAAIDTLSAIFDLTPFERELLLLCAGVEMDSALATRCAELAGRAASISQRNPVTFSLAIATLRSPHWSALAASAPLRRFRLIDAGSRSRAHLGSAAHRRTGAALPGRDQPPGSAWLEDMLFRKSPPEWMDDEHFRLANEILRRAGRGDNRCRPCFICAVTTRWARRVWPR